MRLKKHREDVKRLKSMACSPTMPAELRDIASRYHRLILAAEDGLNDIQNEKELREKRYGWPVTFSNRVKIVLKDAEK